MGLRRGAPVLGATLALAAAGCGSSSPSDQVRATMEGYAKAFARHDYQALCDRYFAPALVDGVEQAGLPCEAAIRPAIKAAVRPVLTVRGVSVHGDRATARVHTAAANQPASDDTIALLRVQGRWRISSLAEQGPQPTG